MSRFALFVAALSLLGCAGTAPLEPVSDAPGEEDALLLSTVHVADPRAFDQLLEGFHRLEGGSWRWTERRFALLLEPPPPVPFHDNSLELRFTVPEVTIEQLGAVTVTASLDGAQLGSQTIDEAAENIVFTSAVPADLIGKKPLRAEFALDHAMPPSEQDGRELGIVVLSVALQ